MCVQLDELHEEAGRVLEDLRTVLPERNLRVPDVASAEADEHQDSSDLGSSDKDLEDSDSEDADESHSDSAESSVDASASVVDSPSDSEDAVDSHLIVSKAWTFPKAHAMCHASTTVRLFGPLEGSSGESLEKRHVAIKDSFQHGTNNHAGCELQVLCAEMRVDDTWCTNGGLGNEPARAEGVPQHARHWKPGVAARERTNASFQDNVHISARRFPVWEVACRWRKCRRELKYAAVRSHVLTTGGSRSKVKVAIPMRSLYDGSSEWRQNCADMKHLPAELPRYIRDTYSEYWVAGQFPKIGGEALSWPQIVDLCARVQPSQRGISQGFCHSHGCTEAHLEVFNALEIVCPGVPGQVNRTRVHRASSSICYGTCIVCCKHAFDSP